MTVELKIEGLEALQKSLRLLPKEVQNKGAKFAGRKAANVIRDAAKKNARSLDDPSTAENISENIAIKFSPKEFKKNGTLVYRIGVLGGAKTKKKRRPSSSSKKGGDTFYWRFLEFGTSKTKAQPFLRPAIAEKSQAATNEFIKEVGKWLDRRIKKLDKGST